jgi:hypothetical protein
MQTARKKFPYSTHNKYCSAVHLVIMNVTEMYVKTSLTKKSLSQIRSSVRLNHNNNFFLQYTNNVQSDVFLTVHHNINLF